VINPISTRSSRLGFQTNSREVEVCCSLLFLTITLLFQTNSREVEVTPDSPRLSGRACFRRTLVRLKFAISLHRIGKRKFQTNSREVEVGFTQTHWRATVGFQTNSREVEAYLARTGRYRKEFQTNSREVEASIRQRRGGSVRSFRRTLVRLKQDVPASSKWGADSFRRTLVRLKRAARSALAKTGRSFRRTLVRLKRTRKG